MHPRTEFLHNVNVANILIRSEKVSETCKIYAKKCVITLDVLGFIVLIHSLAKDVPKTRKHVSYLPMEPRDVQITIIAFKVTVK